MKTRSPPCACSPAPGAGRAQHRIYRSADGARSAAPGGREISTCAPPAQASQFEDLRKALPPREVITHIRQSARYGHAGRHPPEEADPRGLAHGLEEQRLECHPHRVRVFRVEGQLAVSFHCHFDPAVNITQVHALTELMERELRSRMPAIRRVIIHTEPGRPESTG
jgi:hypothetical protein